MTHWYELQRIQKERWTDKAKNNIAFQFTQKDSATKFPYDSVDKSEEDRSRKIPIWTNMIERKTILLYKYLSSSMINIFTTR